MSELRVLNDEGVTVGKASLSEALAAQDIKPHLIHETVVAEAAERRAGTHATKTRSDVRGGGAKPWRQKGTGRARAGSSRSPIWTGGGVVFGPTPRSYGGKVNRKIRQQAFTSALRAHAERGSAAVMEPLGWDKPSTKSAAAYLFQAPERMQDLPLLVVVADLEGLAARSFRNLEGVTVVEPADVQTVDLMQARSVLVEKEIWESWAGESKVESVTAKKRSVPAKKKAAPAEKKADGEDKPAAKKKAPAKKPAAKKAATKKAPAKKKADGDDKPAAKKKAPAKKKADGDDKPAAKKKAPAKKKDDA